MCPKPLTFEPKYHSTGSMTRMANNTRFSLPRHLRGVRFMAASLLAIAPLMLLTTPAQADIGFSAATQTVLETAGSATLTLSRSGDATQAGSVRVLITHGTATAGDDFSGGETTVSWSAGETGERSITLSITGDALAEGTETVYFALTDVGGDTLAALNTTQLIIDDAGGTVAEDTGLSVEQQEAGEVLDSICQSSGQETGTALDTSCEAFQQLTNEQQQDTVESILPRYVAQQTGTAAIAQTGSSRAIQQRMQTVRVGGGSTGDVSGLLLRINGEPVPLQAMLDTTTMSGAAAGGGLLDERWGAFLSGQVQLADQDSTEQALGYRSDAQQLTAGVDYRFTPQIFAGTALSGTQSDADSNAEGGKQQGDVLVFSVFGNYYLSERFYLDGLLSYGTSHYDTERLIRLGSQRSSLTSQTDGQQTGIALTLGYDRSEGPWQWGGHARAETTQFDIDAYEEAGSSGFALGIGDQQSSSAQTAFGGNIAYVKAVNYGIWVPKLTVEWVHEYKDSVRDIEAYFVSEPTAGRFVITTQEPDRDFFNVGWSVAGTFANSRSAYVRYEALVGRDNYIAELIEVGGRIAF